MSVRGAIDERLGLKYGAGGRAMRSLISSVFVEGFADHRREDVVGLEAMDDGAVIPAGDRSMVITTDSHVVHPIFFPGGDIGRLAICGTVNDLAMMGATAEPSLALAVIVEEGFLLEDLQRIRRSMHAACAESGARIVTGDTKVMGKGELDGIAINTTGVAFTDRAVRDNGMRAGDKLIVTGTIGDHGFAVLAKRQKLQLEGALSSDVAPINGLVRAALAVGGAQLTAMKDPTRGGLAAALQEMAEKSGLGVCIEQAALPISEAVLGASELLGIDPLHVANEGKAVLSVHPDRASAVLDVIRAHPLGRRAAIIGTAIESHRGAIILDTGFGRRIVPELEGDPLPRIC